jgi:hypothetical protein
MSFSCDDGIRGFCGEQGIEQKEACSDDDGTVGYIEVGPVITKDMDLDEINDGAVDDAIVQIAKSPAEYQGKGDRGKGDPAAKADQGDDDSDRGDCGEGDESPTDGVGGSGVSEKRKGRSLIEPMGDAQETGNYCDTFAEGNVRSDDCLGDAIGNDDEHRDEEEPGEFVRRRKNQWAASDDSEQWPVVSGQWLDRAGMITLRPPVGLFPSL